MVFFTVLLSDLRLGYRRREELLSPVLFFIIVVSLFPLALKLTAQDLQLLAPTIIWIAALLGILMSLNTLFYPDFLEGSLESLLLSVYPLEWLILAKTLAHWIVSSLPIVLISPFLAYMLHLPFSILFSLMLSLIMGTFILNFIGVMGISLTVGLRNGGILLSLLVLPLYIPVLIFGLGMVESTEVLSSMPFLYLVAALFLSISLCPWVAAFALRMSMY
jgi:heme exporter protein B